MQKGKGETVYHSRQSMNRLGMAILRYWPQFLKAPADLQTATEQFETDETDNAGAMHT